MDASSLVDCDFTPEEDAMVISTRVRVGRNLKGYPLGTGISKEKRLEVMAKIVKACNTFEGDLEGMFYPIQGMDKAT